MQNQWTIWLQMAKTRRILFNNGFDNAHNADADNKATADCYFKMKKRELIN